MYMKIKLGSFDDKLHLEKVLLITNAIIYVGLIYYDEGNNFYPLVFLDEVAE